jgi:hypothetical protein
MRDVREHRFDCRGERWQHSAVFAPTPCRFHTLHEMSWNFLFLIVFPTVILIEILKKFLYTALMSSIIMLPVHFQDILSRDAFTPEGAE